MKQQFFFSFLVLCGTKRDSVCWICKENCFLCLHAYQDKISTRHKTLKSCNYNPNKIPHFLAVVFSKGRNIQNYDRPNHYFGSRLTNIKVLKKQIWTFFTCNLYRTYQNAWFKQHDEELYNLYHSLSAVRMTARRPSGTKQHDSFKRSIPQLRLYYK
jgi:hypothetical protein